MAFTTAEQIRSRVEQGDTTITNQEVFDAVVQHLAAQNAKSLGKFDPTDEDAVCFYRGDGGKMCAIGALIPDSQYTANVEGYKASGVIAQFEKASAKNHSLGLLGGILDDLQDCHDDVSIERWPETLMSIGLSQKLNVDVVAATFNKPV